MQIARMRSEWQILCGDRFRSIVRELREPEIQRPVVLGLIGRRLKERAIRCLFPRNNHSKRTKNSTVSLNIDMSTADSPSPVLYADWELDPRVSADCQNTPGLSKHTVRLECSEVSELMHALSVNLLFPFIDVLCVFVEDFRPDEIQASFQMWNDMRKPMAPRLIIVASHLSMEVSRKIQNMSKFASTNLVLLYGAEQLSPSSLHRRLKEVVQLELDISRQARATKRYQFCARHLEPFFASALDHFVSGKRESFEFVPASRAGNPVPTHLASHIRELIHVLHSHGVTCSAAAKEVAARIFLDAYPRGSHRQFAINLLSTILTRSLDFHPDDVFNSLYKHFCYEASQHGPFVPSEFICLVRFNFQVLCTEFERQGLSSPGFYLKTIHDSLDWKHIFSLTTCLLCAARNHENIQSCGHGICDVCARRYGEHSENAEYRFDLKSCPLCEHPGTLSVKQVPPTANFRTLSLDGGGVGGIFSLIALQALEAKLGYPVQDEFDYVVGTSSGTSGPAYLQFCGC